MKITMKLLFFAVVVIGICVLYADSVSVRAETTTGEGRFQVAVSESCLRALLVDTNTGQVWTWAAVKETEGWVPIPFIKGKAPGDHIWIKE